MEKNPKNRSLIMVIGVLVLGAILGSLVGEVLKMAVPDGVVKEVFLTQVDMVVGPGVLDMIVFSVTIGFSLSLNLVAILGMVGAYYVLRFWR